MEIPNESDTDPFKLQQNHQEKSWITIDSATASTNSDTYFDPFDLSSFFRLGKESTAVSHHCVLSLVGDSTLVCFCCPQRIMPLYHEATNHFRLHRVVNCRRCDQAHRSIFQRQSQLSGTPSCSDFSLVCVANGRDGFITVLSSSQSVWHTDCSGCETTCGLMVSLLSVSIWFSPI